MTAQRSGTPGKVRKPGRGTGRTLFVRSAATGRFLSVREAAHAAEPVPDHAAIPNGGLAAALERLKALPPDACAWVHDLPPLPADVPEIIGPRPKGASRS